MKIVVCDDETGVRFAIAEVLLAAGFEVIEAASGDEALRVIERADALVTDLSMPGMDGLELMRQVKARDPQVPVVLLTARGSERVAVQAMKAGAYDYLAKPFDADELVMTVRRALEGRELRQQVARAAAERSSGRVMIGDAPVMRALQADIARLAPRDVTVLVRGATGTGKELVARMLHELSRRARGPLVVFNCAALAPELAEAELFGHARGAFTGAQQARAGFFAKADGGTIVLDEIGELPLGLQPKLLRALQDGEIQPVGGRVEKVDVRVVSMTHRDLLAEARTGRFREDLYYRLAVVELTVPALSERTSDIAALARAFARRFGERFGLDDVRLSDAVCQALAARSWPGNVRELENAVGRLVALSDGGLIDRTDPPSTDAPAGSLRDALDALERKLVSEALAASQNNKAEAARRLGLSRVTLIDRMKRLGLG